MKPQDEEAKNLLEALRSSYLMGVFVEKSFKKVFPTPFSKLFGYFEWIDFKRKSPKNWGEYESLF